MAAIQPQIEAVLRNDVRLGQEQMTLGATIDYTIKRAGIFALKVVVPSGYRLEAINGTNILQSAERDEAGQHILEVTLKERTTGAYGR